ncbi:MAG: M23 family metallopeptidase [Prevotella sp.]|nr:M23 family metallopeptidase [Bacteroidales bacterium]MDD6744530.1 M23 family metallopeptidase [Bacteroidales bacterium]MDY3841787.1 M23 family metallopeptidase [Prevotella sp.]
MTFKKIVKSIAFGALLFMSAQPVTAQDLLARQAPVDRKMKRVDTLALQNLINRENIQSPSAELYDDWDNTYAHKATELPDSFRIDLRHFHMPTTSRVVTSNFGSRWGRQHKGIDLKVYIGDTIRSAFSGKVRMVKYERGGYGKYIVIRHSNGLETIYGHLSKQLVEENQVVRAGEVIGLGGNTGRSTGSHLHFETRLCGVALNPAILFDFRAQDVVADSYLFRKNTYMAESSEANRLRGKIGNGSYTREEVQGEMAYGSETEQVAEEKQYHKVAKGETLSAIAKKRGVSVSSLCKLNRISKRTRLRPGQILRYS